ncbi:lysozyme inhibitor LprI family protein [Marilutibacter maris]|uniref:DUF1311 domain-containing protein n=1 Tax=Marilutibacter maris TaxID=1605891 RepID=A0A2U9TAP7_9GAMM|nr:lysozyme inhibitor LprI family protein [Lysobacter maris]AWV06599.1 hypothetical protein C9I47_0878 [Lysobacter maris]KAB8188373.1 DUF1311 domain-containing protein [Lysobacter maris]
MIRRSLAIALLALPGLAAAQQPVCDPAGSQQEMNACAFDALAEDDAELNRVYRQVLASRPDDALFAQKLRDAQRLWIQLRDADLDALFPVADGVDPRIEYGSIYPLERAEAKTRMTRERTRYLREHWLDDNGR